MLGIGSNITAHCAAEYGQGLHMLDLTPTIGGAIIAV